jgi:hypothetical protein
MSHSPKKARGPRRINGTEILDVRGCSEFFGWTDRATYSRVARRAIPFRKLPGGRICFLRSELIAFCQSLPGCRPEECIQP